MNAPGRSHPLVRRLGPRPLATKLRSLVAYPSGAMPEHQGGTSRFVRGADYFSILKRGINGVYHHISHEHLPMYLAEFDFRYDARSGLGISDPQRAGKLLKGIIGKRLTYRRPDEAQDH